MGGRTGITKLIVALRNFANAPKDDFLVTYDENKISVFSGTELLVYIIVLNLCSRYWLYDLLLYIRYCKFRRFRILVFRYEILPLLIYAAL
jgi:hypothetical protein